MSFPWECLECSRIWCGHVRRHSASRQWCLIHVTPTSSPLSKGRVPALLVHQSWNLMGYIIKLWIGEVNSILKHLHLGKNTIPKLSNAAAMLDKRFEVTRVQKPSGKLKTPDMISLSWRLVNKTIQIICCVTFRKTFGLHVGNVYEELWNYACILFEIKWSQMVPKLVCMNP